jgi:hypothetical protein
MSTIADFEARTASCKTVADFAALAREAAVVDAGYAKALIEKAQAQAKGLADFLDLAATLKAQGEAAAALDLYKKAARHLDGMADTVAYATGFIDVFADPAAARKVLEDAETDCQFPKDFADLAGGFKEICGDQAKVAELMEQAAEFAMSGEEHLDLARGYWDLLGDRAQAAAAFAKALPEVNDKNQLLELGGFIASQVGDPELGKRFYAKAEEKLASAAERIKLAEAVLKDTGDKGYAAAVYGRAADRLTQPNDLMAVAANLVDQLGDQAAAAAIYRKAMAAMSDLGQYTKLLEAVDTQIGDQGFGREILERAAAVAAGTPDYLDLARRAAVTIGDQDLARGLLGKAEEQVSSVGEMKNVVAAVKEHFAGMRDWVAQVEEKLARREANQEKYALFQEREKSADSAVKTLKLADAVMAELEDRFYAQKLLADAQQRLEEEGWDFSKARKLVEGVSRHLGDSAWAERLLKDAGERIQGFAGVSAVAESAVELLPDRERSRALVADLLDGFARQLGAAAGVYDLTKLAAVRGRLLGDTAGAAAVLEQAAGQAAGHFQFAELARVARDLGLDTAARDLVAKAAACCVSAAAARQLAGRLSADGVEPEQIRAVYAGLKARLSQSADRVEWAESIVDLFGDRAWAKQELDALAQSAPAAEAAVIVRRARRRAAHA